MIKLGIDADIEKSGVAVVENGKIKVLHKLSFPDLVTFVVELSSQREVQVMLEDVEANKPIFWRDIKGTPEQKRKINLSIAQKVGMVKAVARLIRQALESKGITVHMIKPLKGNVKKAKEDAAYFNQITGWDKRSNEDGRDAALIAMYGVIK